MKIWLVDTGPIVALLASDDLYHSWAVEQSKSAPATVHTCEAVLSEATCLLKRGGHAVDPLFALVEAGFLRVDFDFQPEARSIRALMHRYRDRPMSFADACMVRMAELNADTCIWTLDDDFRVYRKHRRQTLSLVIPDE